MRPDVLVEALLFYKATAMRKRAIASAVGCDLEQLATYLDTLRTRLTGTAITLVETTEEVQLVTAPAVASFLDAVRRDELRADIGKAGAETLAIILYREPISRTEIDKIRGVNSSVTLRNLLTRGLISRSTKPTAQGYIYNITPQLLTHLGLSHKQTLPEYAAIMNRLDEFLQTEEVETT